MKILGISTASKYISIGLIDDSTIIAEFTVKGGKSENLIPLLDTVLSRAGIDQKEIEAIGVVDGPGSYSGLRGGMSAAKSIVQVLDVPIIGISCLEAIAYNFKNLEGTIGIIMDAVKGELNFALFSSDTRNIRRLTEDIVVKEERIRSFIDEISGKLYIVDIKNILDNNIDSNSSVNISDEINNIPYGVNVARLALDKLRSGEKDDYLTLVPKYSHMPNIREYKKA